MNVEKGITQQETSESIYSKIYNFFLLEVLQKDPVKKKQIYLISKEDLKKFYDLIKYDSLKELKANKDKEFNQKSIEDYYKENKIDLKPLDKDKKIKIKEKTEEKEINDNMEIINEIVVEILQSIGYEIEIKKKEEQNEQDEIKNNKTEPNKEISQTQAKDVNKNEEQIKQEKGDKDNKAEEKNINKEKEKEETKKVEEEKPKEKKEEIKKEEDNKLTNEKEPKKSEGEKNKSPKEEKKHNEPNNKIQKQEEIIKPNDNIDQLTPEKVQFNQQQMMIIQQYFMENGWENNFINNYLLNIPAESEVPDDGLPHAKNGIIQLESNKPSLGLQNVGASFYMNATLECLIHIKELSQLLLSAFFFKYPMKNKDYAEKHKLTLNYINLLSQVFFPKLYGNQSKYYAPYEFKSIICEINPLFEGE